MSKAEEKAYECFPNEDVESKKARFGFLLGYHQAEKDLELGWEDIALINDIVSEMLNDCGDNILYDTEKNFCQEVLKRFNKEKKEN